MPLKKNFGFGIVGAGVISHFHAKAFAATKYADLIGVYSINNDKSNQFARKYNCAAYYNQRE